MKSYECYLCGQICNGYKGYARHKAWSHLDKQLDPDPHDPFDLRMLPLTPNIAAFVGHVFGDGHLDYWSKYCEKLGHQTASYRIMYINSNPRYIKHFTNLAYRLFGDIHIEESSRTITQINNAAKRNNSPIRARKKQFNVNLHSKILVHSFCERFGNPRTFNWEIPREIMEAIKPIRHAFLESFIMDEGSVTSRNVICITSKNPNLLKFKNLIKDFYDFTWHTNSYKLKTNVNGTNVPSHFFYLKRVFPTNDLNNILPPYHRPPAQLLIKEKKQLKQRNRWSEYQNLRQKCMGSRQSKNDPN